MAISYESLSILQKNAVDANGNTLVYAAAGSGKTAVLTERVRRLIKDEKNSISADRLLVVTFTNDAAAEMRARISEAIADEMEKHPSEYIGKQLMLLGGAKICTIDSFCRDIIKENFEAAGVRPDYKIVDETTKRQIYTDTVNKLFLERISNPDFKKLVDTVKVSNFADTVYEVYEKLRSMPDSEAWLDKQPDSIKTFDEYKNMYFALIKDNVEEIKAAAIVIEEQLDGKELPEKAEIMINLAKTLSMAYNKDYDAFITATKTKINMAFGNTKDTVLVNAKKSFGEQYKAIQSIYSVNESDAKEYLAEQKSMLSVFGKFIKDFGEEYRKTLIEKNYLTFDMLEHIAFDMIAESDGKGGFRKTAMGEKIAAEYDAVLVDEYQDNNSLQDRLFYLVSDYGKNLFMVGDAKQSIYGFRYANPRNFINYRDTYPHYNPNAEQDKSKITLLDNYRSQKGICDYVNFVFGKIMQKKVAEMDYTADDKMNAMSYKDYKDEVAVDIRAVEYENGNSDEASRYAADDIARYIKDAVENKTLLIPADRKCEGKRNVRYEDFAVLFRTRTRMGKYKDAFKKYGVPVVFKSVFSFEAREIRILMSTLKAINKPTDDVSLLAVMTCPVFSVPIEAVTRVKIDYAAKNLYGSVCLAAKNGDTTMKKVVDELSYWKRKSFSMGVTELVREIIDRYDMLETAVARDDCGEAANNINEFTRIAEAYESDSKYGLGGFIRYLNNKEQEKNSDGVMPDGVDAVKMMTVHGSKGLEFPICIIAECADKFENKDAKGRILVHEDAGLAIKMYDSVKHQEKLPFNTVSVKSAMADSNRAEEQRILYVAMTRAMNRLILMVNDKIESSSKGIKHSIEDYGVYSSVNKINAEDISGASSWQDFIMMTANLSKEGIPESDKPHFSLTRVHIPTEACGEVEEKKLAEGDEALANELKERFEISDSIKSVSVESKTSVSKIMSKEYQTELGFSGRPAALLESGMTGAEKGTALHIFMQHADYELAKNDLEGVIKELVEWEYISETEAESLDRGKIEKFLSSSLCDEIIKAGKGVWREKEFLVPYGDDGTLIQGAVDCVFIKDDRLVIVDFKTTKYDTDKEFIDTYKVQLDVYGEAMKEIFELEVAERYIYSFYLGKVIKV